MTSEYPQTLQ